MPAACLVCGATKKANNKVKLFHFAVITQKLDHLQEISKRRRHEWLRVLRINEEDLKASRTGHYICSRHFKSGEPAKVQDVTNPDWIPSQNITARTDLGINQSENKKVRPPIDKSDLPEAKYRKSTVNTPIGMEPKSETDGSVGDKKDETITQLKLLLKQKDQLILCLQVKLRHNVIEESSFVDDDLKTQFYTGFATYKCFAAFASTVADLLPQSEFPEFTKMKMLTMVVAKLRLNLPIAYLSLKFEIPFESLCEMFTSSVRQLADHLQVTWPANRKIPKFLNNIFGKQLAAIVDILELKLDFGSGYFKSIKFLIAYSPSGRISFVSKAFPGFSSDSAIMAGSGLLNQLNASDLILALRGTLHEDVVVPSAYPDKVFMYGIGNNGLVRLLWNDSLSIDLRINLRALMDQLITIFGFLEHKQPEMLMEDPTAFLSKAVMLCAALRNLILPV